jgi:hypothetical protein
MLTTASMIRTGKTYNLMVDVQIGPSSGVIGTPYHGLVTPDRRRGGQSLRRALEREGGDRHGESGLSYPRP